MPLPLPATYPAGACPKSVVAPASPGGAADRAGPMSDRVVKPIAPRPRPGTYPVGLGPSKVCPMERGPTPTPLISADRDMGPDQSLCCALLSKDRDVISDRVLLYDDIFQLNCAESVPVQGRSLDWVWPKIFRVLSVYRRW